MALLGALILVVVALAVAAALLRGGAAVTVDLEWFTIKTETRVIFFAGAAALLLFVLGGWLLARGLKRVRHRRSEVKDLRRRAEASEEAARRERADGAPASGTSPPPEASRRRDGPDDHFDSVPRER